MSPISKLQFKDQWFCTYWNISFSHHLDIKFIIPICAPVCLSVHPSTFDSSNHDKKNPPPPPNTTAKGHVTSLYWEGVWVGGVGIGSTEKDYLKLKTTTIKHVAQEKNNPKKGLLSVWTGCSAGRGLPV